MHNITNMKPCTIFLHIMCHIFHIDLHIMVYCFAYLAYQFTYFAYILSYFAYCNITNMQNMKPCTIICHIMLHIYVKLYVTLNSICRICQIICRKICQNMQNAWRVYISHIGHIYALLTHWQPEAFKLLRLMLTSGILTPCCSSIYNAYSCIYMFEEMHVSIYNVYSCIYIQ